MTKLTFAAAFIGTMMAVANPALAFTPGGSETDLSATYGNMPSWQPHTAERNDSVYRACVPAIAAGVNWRQCFLAVLAQNRDKFPASLNSDDDFFLAEGVIYNIPVFAGATVPADPAAVAMPTRADLLAMVDIFRQFEAKIIALEGDMVTQAELDAAITVAIANAAKAPGNNALTALETELAAQADRLTAIEATLTEQASVNTTTATKLEALAAENAAAALVLEGHGTRLTATETMAIQAVTDVAALDTRVGATEAAAAQAAADAAAAQAAAARAEAALAAGLAQGGSIDIAIDNAVNITNPQNAIGQALEGKVDDAELTQAVADGVATVQTEVTSIWTWIFGTMAGLVALALLGLLGFYLNRGKANGAVTQVTELEARTEVLEGHATGIRDVIIPETLAPALLALAKGSAEHVDGVTVDGKDYELGFTWAEPQNGKARVLVRGIKDQTESVYVSRINGCILRAAGTDRLIPSVAFRHVRPAAAPAPAAAVAKAATP